MPLLDRNSVVPLYLQIRDRLRASILNGSLPAGTKLPAERQLAEELGVNRMTVNKAYRELEAEGLISSHVGRGTTVEALPSRSDSADTNPTPPPWAALWSGWARQTGTGLALLMESVGQEALIPFAAGAPAPELFPASDFERIVVGGLAGQAQELFQHCPVEGLPYFRDMLGRRLIGPSADPEAVLILSGSQQGLDLLARVFLEPGDPVVIESPSYLGAVQVFRGAGARILPVPLDAEGMRVDELERILSRHRPKFIYTLPNFQNPTGINMSVQRRQALLALAVKHQIPVIEDDPYGELYYKEAPPPTLKSMDPGDYVIYLSTFSKTLGPGLRLGWMIAPRPVIQQVARLRQLADLHSGGLSQWFVYEFIRQGLYDHHLHTIREEYRQRRDAMGSALEALAVPGLDWRRPAGGMYFWCRLPVGLRSYEVRMSAWRKGVAVAAGDIFCTDGSGPRYLRLNFTRPGIPAITDGIARLGLVLRDLTRRQPTDGTQSQIGTRPMV